MVDPVDDAMVSGLTPALPTRESVDPGVEVPIPTFPLAKIVRNEVPDEDATVRAGRDPARACRNTEDDVVVVPAFSPPKKDVPP